MTKALKTLARLRKLQADMALADLAQAIAQQSACETLLAGQRRAVLQERRQLPPDPTHPAAHSFAAWLPEATRIIQKSAQAVSDAEQQSQAARAHAHAQKAALRAVHSLIEEQAATARQAADRTQQIRLDEAAQRAKPR